MLIRLSSVKGVKQMAGTHVLLGTRTIEDVHEEAILLWIAARRRDTDPNPAQGIYFALTGQPWPTGVPEVANAIDLCALLSEVTGQQPLSDDQRRALNAKALHLSLIHDSGGGPLRLYGYSIWANRIAYGLGAVSMLVSGPSWWIAGLMFGAWSCFGAARAAAGMRNQEPRPSWEVPLIAAMYFVALVSLYVVSVIHLVNQ